MKKLFNRNRVIAVAGIMLSLAACSDDDADDEGVSASAGSDGVMASVEGLDARQAQLALDELTASVDLSVTGFSHDEMGAAASVPGASASASPAGASASAGAAGSAPDAPDPSTDAPSERTTSEGPAINVACAGGGGAEVAGHVNIVPAPVNVDVQVGIAYERCVTARGTTIAGSIDFSQSVAAGPGTPLRVETVYSGDVELRGPELNARCSVDVNVLVDEAGRAVEAAGDFCGQDASALKLQIMPRWGAAR